jgi:hypothetical protein
MTGSRKRLLSDQVEAKTMLSVAIHLMKGSLPGLVIAAILLASLALPESTHESTLPYEEIITLTTQDGFRLIFDSQAKKFSHLEVPGYSADLSQKPDLGVYLYDPAGTIVLDADTTPVKSYQMIGNSLHLSRENGSQNIRTEEIWTAYEKHIELEANITHTGYTPTSRAIEACVEVPLDLEGQQWYHHLHQSETIQLRPEPYQTLLTKLVDTGSFGDGSYHVKSDLDFNLHGLNLIGGDTFGLAIAINPEKPAAYYVKYDATRGSYGACFHLGIYKDHLENTDSVSFNLAFFFPDEPEWGLRSALQKYVSIYPESFVGSLEPRSGMVVGEDYNYNEYPNPGEFHIGAMWNGFKAENVDHGIYSLVYLWPTGFIDRGMRLTASGTPTGPDQSWEADIAACLSIYQDYDQGRNPFKQTCIGPIPFKQCTNVNPAGRVYGPIYDPASSRYYNVRALQVTVTNFPNYLFGQFSIYEPFSSSLLQDGSGGHANAMSFASAMSELGWDPDYVRCLFNGFNPDPGLEVSPSNELSLGPAPTQTNNFGHLSLEIAKRANGLYGASYLYEEPENGLNLYNGAAVDTVGAYLRQDFNPDMLRVASLPLSYDTSSGRVVSLEHLNLLAFLKALRASLPPDAALSMNGNPISGILGQEIDFFMDEMLGREVNSNWIDELYDEDLQTRLRRINRIRMSAYQRPITFWAIFDRAGTEQKLLEQMRQYLPLYTSKGIYINLYGYGYQGEKSLWGKKPQNQAVIQEYKRHLDAVHALTVAGWEPVPFAKSFDQAGSMIPDILVERFGNKCFTLYNGGDQAIDFRVNIDWSKIGLSATPVGVKDWETGQVLSSTVSGGTLTVSGLHLSSQAVQILEIQQTQSSGNEPGDWRVYLPIVFGVGEENSRCNG